jgi:putative flippase GtrA
MSTRREAMRFLVVGGITVCVDLAAYRLLLWAGMGLSLAKALGFTAGTVFAYFANKTFTFDRAPGGLRRFAIFCAVYGTTLLVNVGLNAAVVEVLGRSELGLGAAFLCATGTSATLNFIGMKHLVFRRSPAAVEPAA